MRLCRTGLFKDEEAGGSSKSESKKGKVQSKIESPKQVGSNDDVRPIERAIEARGEAPAQAAEQLTSLVRTLHFADTFILNC